jgi:hypothetical protein
MCGTLDLVELNSNIGSNDNFEKIASAIKSPYNKSFPPTTRKHQDRVSHHAKHRLQSSPYPAYTAKHLVKYWRHRVRNPKAHSATALDDSQHEYKNLKKNKKHQKSKIMAYFCKRIAK